MIQCPPSGIFNGPESIQYKDANCFNCYAHMHQISPVYILYQFKPNVYKML